MNINENGITFTHVT